MEKIIGIYKITSPSKKIYIGQSKDIIHRFNTYKKYRCKSQPLLYNSLIKYGSENHSFDILIQCNISELNKYEIYFIDLFQSFNSKHGLNLQSGGYNGSPSISTKEKLRNINLGKKYSDETNYAKGKAMRNNKHTKEWIEMVKGKPKPDNNNLIELDKKIIVKCESHD